MTRSFLFDPNFLKPYPSCYKDTHSLLEMEHQFLIKSFDLWHADVSFQKNFYTQKVHNWKHICRWVHIIEELFNVLSGKKCSLCEF